MVQGNLDQYRWYRPSSGIHSDPIEQSSYLLLVQGDPVHGRKPAVVLDVVYAIPQVAESLREINL